MKVKCPWCKDNAELASDCSCVKCEKCEKEYGFLDYTLKPKDIIWNFEEVFNQL